MMYTDRQLKPRLVLHIGNKINFRSPALILYAYIVLSLSIEHWKQACLFSCRHSFEYLDKDETIVAHLAGGIDAFFKISAAWPLSSYGLKLISIRNSGTQPTSITLDLLCKTKVKIATTCLKPMFVSSIYIATLHMNNANLWIKPSEPIESLSRIPTFLCIMHS
jgi:hypothetical protein